MDSVWWRFKGSRRGMPTNREEICKRRGNATNRVEIELRVRIVHDHASSAARLLDTRENCPATCAVVSLAVAAAIKCIGLSM